VYEKDGEKYFVVAEGTPVPAIADLTGSSGADLDASRVRGRAILVP
jgi:hypothetical protein